MEERLKIAWICHFSNPEVRSQLTFALPLKKKIKSILGMKPKTQHGDFAPWVTFMAKEIELRDDIETHIISPHRHLKTPIQEIKTTKIKYHFYKPDQDYLIIQLFRIIFSRCEPKYWINRSRIRRILSNVNPDLIVLIGAENPYYSISALEIARVPALLIAQTVYSNPDRMKHSGHVVPFRWSLELKIHHQFKYFSCNAPMHRELILKNNPNAIVFRHRYPFYKPIKIESPIKKYDFVYYAQTVTKKKGIEDAICALGIVKKRFPKVSFDVIGNCEPHYKAKLDTMISDLDLTGNIEFEGYFPKQSDMYKHIQQAKCALLPVKLDSIPGTIGDAFMLDIPVVSYKTTGTPHLNKYGEAALLCEIDDVESLAKNMERVMNEPELVESMLKNARKYVEIEFNNHKNSEMMIRMFYAVYENYHHNTPISKELLFDPEEFPSYRPQGQKS